MTARTDDKPADPMMSAAAKAVDEANQRHIVLKLAEIMDEIGISDPQPAGTNSFHRYKYFKDEQIFGLTRPRLARRGLVIVPEVLDFTIAERETRKEGKSWLTTIRVKFYVIDGHTGRMIEGIGIGQGDDPGDKGANKAMTGAMKFFLLKLFEIGGEDDPEADESTDRRADADRGSDRDRPRDRETRRDSRDDDRRRDREDRDRGRSDESYGGGGYGDYDDAPPVRIDDSNIEGIKRGGRANLATEVQIKQIRELARDLDWRPGDVAKEALRIGLDELELDEDAEKAGPQLVKYLESLRSTEAGELIQEMGRLVERRRERAASDE